MSNPIEEFHQEVNKNIENLRNDVNFKQLSDEWIIESSKKKYSYNFTWAGRPIIQLPQDIVAMQEIIWKVKPDCIVETGIAHGGSLIFYSSMLKMVDFALDRNVNSSRVIGVDIEIREHNRIEIEKNPFSDIISMIEGSSIDDDVISKVDELAATYNKVLVVFDSNHSGEHVLEECRKYEHLVKKGSYMVVMDTVTELLFKTMEETHSDIPDHLKRPWNANNNAMAGVRSFLRENDRFVVDNDYDKLLITCNNKGYLKCVG